MNGKGDSPRNCFSDSYRENYDNIFRKKVIDGAEKNHKPVSTDDKNATRQRRIQTSVGPRGLAFRGMDVSL